MTLTTATNTCPICERPTETTVCENEIKNAGLCLNNILTLAPEVETTVCRQSRYAVRNGRPAMNIKYDNEPKPTGGLRPTQLPVNLDAANKAAKVYKVVADWADMISAQTGAPRPDTPLGQEQVVTDARFISFFLPKMASHPKAVQFVEEMRVCSYTLSMIVDAPEQLQIAGRCECGEYLYAGIDAASVTCRFKTCGNVYDVVQARHGLIEALREFEVTAAQAALLVCYIDPRRDRDRSRKNVIQWGMRERIWSGLSPTSTDTVYRFGEIADRVFREMAEYEAK